jgi:hypothetical protein
MVSHALYLLSIHDLNIDINNSAFEVAAGIVEPDAVAWLSLTAIENNFIA